MDFIETEGKTEREAIESALKRTGATEEEIRIEPCDDTDTGHVKIRVFYDKKKVSVERAKDVLGGILERMDIQAEIEETEREEEPCLNIISENGGLLIGQKGETLNALQSIVNKIVNRNILERVRIAIDVEGYRERQQNELKALAAAEALKAKETDKDITLPPMNSEDRRIVHIALKDDEEIETTSIGEDPNRKIVISLKKQ